MEELCGRLGVDGHRGEITIARAARALAAFEGRRKASAEDVRRVAPMSLRHRLRRDPLEHGGGSARVQKATAELFGESRDGDEKRAGSRKRSTEKGSASSADARGEDANGHDETANSHDETANGRGETAKGAQLVVPPVEVGLKREAVAQRRDDEKHARRAS